MKRDYAEFERKADTKIALLKEVLEALGRGEEVDVEKVLGAGDEKEEKAWEEGMLPRQDGILRSHGIA